MMVTQGQGSTYLLSSLPICFCRALLNAPMKEGQDGVVDVQDVRAPVFKALLHFVYTDELSEVKLGFRY